MLTALSLLAFAANSVLCRYALENGAIDPSSFTSLRLLSGTLMLVFIISLQRQTLTSVMRSKGSWFSGFMLFTYACAFSFAYMLLGAAMGAFLLFGAVTLTMLLVSVYSVNRLPSPE